MAHTKSRGKVSTTIQNPLIALPMSTAQMIAQRKKRCQDQGEDNQRNPVIGEIRSPTLWSMARKLKIKRHKMNKNNMIYETLTKVPNINAHATAMAAHKALLPPPAIFLGVPDRLQDHQLWNAFPSVFLLTEGVRLTLLTLFVSWPPVSSESRTKLLFSSRISFLELGDGGGDDDGSNPSPSSKDDVEEEGELKENEKDISPPARSVGRAHWWGRAGQL